MFPVSASASASAAPCPFASSGTSPSGSPAAAAPAAASQPVKLNSKSSSTSSCHDRRHRSGSRSSSSHPFESSLLSIPLFLHHSPLSMPPSSSEPHRKRRSWSDYIVFLLLLIVLGTVAVLSTVNACFGVYPVDVILPSEMAMPMTPSRVPKIIHQTWKSSEIPQRWIAVRESCAALHDDWEYMLWTDQSGRDLILREYPWFLDTYDGYRYPIQRADAIRYFILHHYGGVYMDLDIGCLRPMDDLLRFDMVLPQTVPVGISNDLMFSAKGHPFMDFVIHRLANFDHDYHFNYATVMFSTGPMALSALLSQFRRYLPLGSQASGSFGPVRVLPSEMYGKNLRPPRPPPGPFFKHYYGSSWHTDGAGAVLWLGKFGIFLLYGAVALVVFGITRSVAKKVLAFRRLGQQPHLVPRPPLESLALKHRQSRGSLWKRRIRRARQGEGRIADAFLLPAHWLGRVSLSSSSKYLRVPRPQFAQSGQPCKCCAAMSRSSNLDHDPELPPYDCHPSDTSCNTSSPGGLQQQLQKVLISTDDSRGAEEHTGALSPLLDHAEQYFTSPTPILVPSTPTFYPSGSSTASANSPAPQSARLDPRGLSSPLQKAIQRLADLTGLTGESTIPESLPMLPARAAGEDVDSSVLSRLNNSCSNGSFKVE